jgi:hypothetical protein
MQGICGKRHISGSWPASVLRRRRSMPADGRDDLFGLRWSPGFSAYSPEIRLREASASLSSRSSFAPSCRAIVENAFYPVLADAFDHGY